MNENTVSEDGPATDSKQSLCLPSDLEALSITRFDDLVAKGQLIYESSGAETVEDEGFKVSCLFASILDVVPVGQAPLLPSGLTIIAQLPLRPSSPPQAHKTLRCTRKDDRGRGQSIPQSRPQRSSFTSRPVSLLALQ